MSIDEKDLIYGRLSRERKECSQDIGYIQAKLSDFSKYFINLSSVLLDGYFLEYLENYPGEEEIIETIKELELKRSRKAEIEKQLEGMK